MGTVHEIKGREVLDTPVLLLECALTDGTVERWSTHRVSAGGEVYEPRVLRQSGFTLSLAAEDGVDDAARFVVDLSNVDGRMSELDRLTGFKGAKLTMRFGFMDVVTGTLTSDLKAVFLGVANPADEITARSARISFSNRMALQRLSVPALRIQGRCPWRFPQSEEQRTEAKDGGAAGEYSQFFRCGYSAGIDGGCGNADGSAAFVSCDGSRESCEQRGMLHTDGAGQETARFGGFAYLPPSIAVRSSGEKGTHLADAVDGRARSNDAVPLVYGTAWIQAPVIFARNDGNLTRCEVLLGSGPIESVHKVIASGVELPAGQAAKDMSGTGWYNVISRGGRNGGFNPSFADSQGRPLGDPHGSMACLEVVVPNRALQGAGLPKMEVLLDGMQLPRFDAEGEELPRSFTRNPAWILLDLLRRAGWEKNELDLASFAATAAQCDEFIAISAPDGTTAQGPRFEVNLALTQRRSLSDVVRGIRIAAALLVRVGEDGRLSVAPEATMARQQPLRAAASNSSAELDGGWPAYEFGDGGNGFSGILMKEDGSPSFRIWRRGSSETPNRLSVELQDAFNLYQQDSVSVVDYDDAASQRCEVSAASGALGLPHYDQAVRVLRLQIEKNVAGNHFVEFETTVQAFGLRPGDLITLSYGREALDRAPYRVLKMSPGLNYESVRVVAQRHRDEWYLVAGGDLEGASRRRLQPGAGGIPRALCGRLLRADGQQEFEVAETDSGGGDTAAWVEVAVRYTRPSAPSTASRAVPMVSLTPGILAGEGTLAPGGTYYYGVTGLDAAGQESAISFLVVATLPAGPDGYAVRLKGLWLSPEATMMRVYRGSSPSRLLRIAETGRTAEFVDDGLIETLAPPPDGAFDHARFQWRMESLPETAAASFSPTTIGNDGLGLKPNEFAGYVARIVSGRGAGQERWIASHSETVLEVTPNWVVTPDGTSTFTIAEASWRPGGISTSDEIRFQVANRPGEVVQVTGVAVNALGIEGALQDAIVTRHEIAGEGEGGDADVPEAPSFAVATSGAGTFEIGGIGFPSLDNTRTIHAGTLTLYYWDELSSPTPFQTSGAMTDEETILAIAASGMGQVADLIQVGNELMRVLEVHEDGASYLVERGVHDTAAAPIAAGSAVYHLSRQAVVLPFARGFFGSPASGSYLQRVVLPAARLAAAEFYVTNTQGSSPTAAQAYTALIDGGLRSMSGGQYAIQRSGIIAVGHDVAPPLIVERACAVRDVFASAGSAPLGGSVGVRLLVNGETYCNLTIAPGTTTSQAANCFGKRPLAEGSRISAEVVTVGTGAGSFPGRDLTVTMRL